MDQELVASIQQDQAVIAHQKTEQSQSIPSASNNAAIDSIETARNFEDRMREKMREVCYLFFLSLLES